MIQLDYIITIIVCIWLIMCSWQDIRRKKIHVILIGIGFLAILACSMISGEITLWNRLAGLSLGIILIILNQLTRGQIGMGDGLIVSILGLCLGFTANAFILVYGLFGSAVFSVFIIILHRPNRKTTIPFIPFLLIGYLGVLFI